ncbi:MAG: hypothetical protein NTW63_03785 [Caldiserica bacterium]|nr:hypothetical protein [Caldisericota bacterium]
MKQLRCLHAALEKDVHLVIMRQLHGNPACLHRVSGRHDFIVAGGHPSLLQQRCYAVGRTYKNRRCYPGLLRQDGGVQ